MTVVALRVPRQPPASSSASWQKLVDMPGGAWPGSGNTINATYYNGHTYIGYIDANGAIRVASRNHTTHAVTVSPAIASGFSVDLHTAPGVLVRSSDHKILVAYTAQATNHMNIAISTNAEDVSAWGTPTDIASTLAGGGQYTYAGLFQLSGESGKIYLYYRDGLDATGKLCYSTSSDGGATWAAQTVLYQATNGAYWSLDSDGVSRIDFAVSDGNAASGDTASLYHFYKSGSSSYFKTDGTAITATLPLAPANLTKLYDGSANGSVRVPYSIIGAGGPYVVLAAANTGGWATHPENYWYAIYSGGSWNIHDITDAGVIPNNDLFEGGATLDAIDPTRVYLTRSSGGNYQVYLYETSDGGATWTSTLLTSDTGDNQNYHPVSPRNADSRLRCLWSSGTIAPDTTQNFTCQIRGYPNPVGAF